MHLLELKLEHFSNDNESVRLETVLSIRLVAPTEVAVGMLQYGENYAICNLLAVFTKWHLMRSRKGLS